MVLVVISVHETTAGYARLLRRFLNNIECAEVLNTDMTTLSPDMVFGDKGFIGGFRARGFPVGGIDIALHGSSAMEIIPRCYMGSTGALWLLERIMNALMDG